MTALPTLSCRSLEESIRAASGCRPRGSWRAVGSCAGRTSRFSSQTRVGIRRLRGCAGLAAEWGLTFVSSPGNVVEYVEPCSSVKPCLRVVVPRRDPEAAVDLAWLDEDRLAVLVGAGFADRLLAIFEDGRLVSHPGPCCPGT